MIDEPAVVVVTGLMASGKSSVADLLARRLPRAAHVRGDGFRRAIVSGRAPMTAPLGAAARDQLRLRHELAAAVADRYAAAGITAVVQDLYLGPDLTRFLERLEHPTVYVVVLAPRPDVIERRDQARDKTGYDGWTVADFDEMLRRDTPPIGMWLDSSELSTAETVDAILNDAEQARVRPAP